ncbi:MAG: transcriptional regulator NrdR [Alphaproteobacteria bacterium]|nr:transcriptional regulator NrdR [Alphaproteobacteria bacterium]
MKCPFCGNDESQVKDSRPTEDNATIRRRRACPSCGARFTTFERVQLRELMVLKTDDKREVFDREKIIRSMSVALRKRPVSEEQIDRAANGVVRQLESLGDAEIPSRKIGGYVMKALANLDAVGYIRYASVYKAFREPEDFNEFLEELKSLQAFPIRNESKNDE